MSVDNLWAQINMDPQMHETDKIEAETDTFRTVLPQILASSAKNMLLLDLGMTIAYPTIAIPELLNSEDDLKFTGEEASWFGSIAFICQPLGSILSGFLFDPLGRKKAMLLVNLPRIVGWLLIYFASSTTHLYVAGVILGVCIGFMEAPVITYLGEICQPKWRGILGAYAGICATFGFLVVNFLGASTDWRTTAAICSGVPMVAFVAIFLVPESPVWLLSKGKVKEAEKSLCWLRGWVQPDNIRKEFSYLLEHNEMYSGKEIITITTISSEINRQTKNRTGRLRANNKGVFVKKIVNILKLNDLFQRSVIQPLVLLTLFFIVHHTSGNTSTRPFMVEIFKEFGTDLDENWISVISSVIGIIGNIVGMLWLRVYGKRKLAIISSLTCGLCNFAICIYGMLSFNEHYSWIPISLFISLNFCWSFGIGQIPWMLISEIFPIRGRGVASGIAAAASYTLGFIFTKTYYDMHESLSLPGVFGVFAAFMLLGTAFIYHCLPETEGKTLREIEFILSDTFNKLLRRRDNTDNVLHNEREFE